MNERRSGTEFDGYGVVYAGWKAQRTYCGGLVIASQDSMVRPKARSKVRIGLSPRIFSQ